MSVRLPGNANLRAWSPHSENEGSDLVQAGENENPIVLIDETGHASSSEEGNFPPNWVDFSDRFENVSQCE